MKPWKFFGAVNPVLCRATGTGGINVKEEEQFCRERHAKLGAVGEKCCG